MSWSLALRNGDLALGGTQLATVTGSQKLVQDLRCALLEPMGTDPVHPSFGSLIDGGRRADGTVVPSPLGGNNWSRIALQIETEIRRIADEHRQRQLTRAQSDQMIYGRPTLDAGELLIEIVNIAMTQIQTTLLIQVTLQVGDETQHTIVIPIPNVPVV